MSSQEIRERFLKFFKAKGHTIVPSSSLIPDDPSVLLTTAGMQQFKPYFVGEADPVKDFGSKNTASIQKSFRTSDIDSVGDESHLTFFEMLGNFSFGGYGKAEAIKYAHEFITGELGLEIDYVSVFGGEGGIKADQESKKIWGEVDENILVKEAGREDNFWGPTGAEGPCGPTTEIYVNGVEVWNIVFNEYYCRQNKSLTPLKFLGVDTGLGLERLAMVVQKTPTIFETDLFSQVFSKINQALPQRIRRIIADHIRAIVFLVSDGIHPSNKEAGYILRRLIRRVITYTYNENIGRPPQELIQAVIDEYKVISYYENLDGELVKKVFQAEYDKFIKTLGAGLRELAKMDSINARSAFKLYESFGLPYEVVKELGGQKAEDLSRLDFDEEFKKHQEVSRAGQAQKFGGHGLLLDTGELKAGSEEEIKKVTRLHTATHLLNQALHDVLGDEVEQRGSDITPDRTRFDFTFGRKVTSKELKKIEDIVNKKIQEDLPVKVAEMNLGEALKSGARAFFKRNYPLVVNVYSIGEYSQELCGGPHLASTGQIGKFKIIKEESSSSGVRRIRAIVE